MRLEVSVHRQDAGGGVSGCWAVALLHLAALLLADALPAARLPLPAAAPARLIAADLTGARRRARW